MSKLPTLSISTSDLIEELRKHDIAAELIGKPRIASKFCSLRAPEPSGVYYATSEIQNLPAVTESIFISDRPSLNIDLDCNSVLVTPHPQRAFYIAQRAYHKSPARSGIHPTAIISQDAEICPSAYIGPYCIVDRAVIGSNCVLESHVVVRDNVVLENDITIESHSTLGATGVAWVWDASNSQKIVQPQTGGVHIGKHTFIGTDVTVVRGSINEVTTIGANCLIAHGTKIGHGCRIGDLVHFANNVSIAGSVTIGRESFLSSGCVIRPRIELPRGTTVGAGAVVVSSFESEYATLVGVPAKVLGRNKGRMAGVPARDP